MLGRKLFEPKADHPGWIRNNKLIKREDGERSLRGRARLSPLTTLPRARGKQGMEESVVEDRPTHTPLFSLQTGPSQLSGPSASSAKTAPTGLVLHWSLNLGAQAP
ncbi:hypothetical protein DdX_11543 [Ditylenchus destructor]|uniref:Uncharacterized protein n=1 Tax=Ditylenchus destructor TaxID=166010 RepID=A0AAD4R4J5_9BILA|nr:hypothetical protein DdX_11543 [Ditylenchus destructor]